MINSSVIIFEWHQILPAAIESLSPLHRDIVTYIINLPGKRRPSYRHAQETWSLDREHFDIELRYAYEAIRLHLLKFGVSKIADLDTEETRETRRGCSFGRGR